MSDWIPATRESAGYYADDPPKRDLRTCRERQDAAIADLHVSVGYAQAADALVARVLAELTHASPRWRTCWYVCQSSAR